MRWGWIGIALAGACGARSRLGEGELARQGAGGTSSSIATSIATSTATATTTATSTATATTTATSTVTATTTATTSATATASTSASSSGGGGSGPVCAGVLGPTLEAIGPIKLASTPSAFNITVTAAMAPSGAFSIAHWNFTGGVPLFRFDAASKPVATPLAPAFHNCCSLAMNETTLVLGGRGSVGPPPGYGLAYVRINAAGNAFAPGVLLAANFPADAVPGVALASDGGVVAAYRDLNVGGLVLRRYNPADQPLAGAVAVDQPATHDGAVAVNGAGTVMVTLQQAPLGTVERRFDANDKLLDAQTLEAGSPQSTPVPAVALGADGRAVVAWTTGTTVRGAFVDAKGPAGAPFALSDAPAASGNTSFFEWPSPALGVDGEGRFLVAWTGTDGTGHFRRFTKSGAAAEPSNAFGAPGKVLTVAAAAAGCTGFVLVWVEKTATGADAYALRIRTQ